MHFSLVLVDFGGGAGGGRDEDAALQKLADHVVKMPYGQVWRADPPSG